MKNLNKILSEIAMLLNMATDKKTAIKKNLTKYLQLDYNSIYGGYRLVNVNVNGGGHSGAFGKSDCCARLSNKEMTLYLNGLLNGLEIQK